MNINKAGDYFLIPVSLAQHVLKHRLVKELNLYIALKVISSGQVVWNIETKVKVATKMKVTTRTIENIFPKLVALNWARCHKSKVYLQSFDFITNSIDSSIRTGVQFHPDDLLHFRAFLIGTLMGYLVNMQKLKVRNDRRLGLCKKRDNNSTKRLSFYPIANVALASILECSIATACNYKTEAAKFKYILQKKHVVVYENVLPENIHSLKKAMPEKSARLWIKKNKVVEQLPDLIAPALRYKARKKVGHIKGGYRGKQTNPIKE